MDLEVREFGQREEKAYGERYLRSPFHQYVFSFPARSVCVHSRTHTHTCAWVLYVGVLNRVRTHEEARVSSSITSLLCFYRDLILYVCVCVCGHHVCVHANGGQKRGVDPLELDL